MGVDLVPATQGSPIGKAPTIRQNDDGSYRVSITCNEPGGVGRGIVVEEINPADEDALYTVPANKTFTGWIVLTNSVAAGTLAVDAATGGTIAQCVGSGYAVIPVTVAGGGGGNALEAEVSGGALGSVLIVGNVK